MEVGNLHKTKNSWKQTKMLNSIYFHCSRLSRQNSLPSLNERKVSAPPPSTSHSGSTLGGGGTGNGGGLRRSTVVARSPSSAKEVILSWVQERTNTYPVIIQKIQYDLCFVYPIFSSFGFWYFGQFSWVILFPVFSVLPILPFKM